MSQQIQQSLWGRMLARKPAPAKRHAPVKPAVSMPTHRPLTVRDKLWTVDGQGQRVYVALAVEGIAGRWAGREWQHCGERDGLLMARWPERDDPMAPLCWHSLAGELVSIVEGGQAA